MIFAALAVALGATFCSWVSLSQGQTRPGGDWGNFLTFVQSLGPSFYVVVFLTNCFRRGTHFLRDVEKARWQIRARIRQNGMGGYQVQKDSRRKPGSRRNFPLAQEERMNNVVSRRGAETTNQFLARRGVRPPPPPLPRSARPLPLRPQPATRPYR